MPTREPDPPCAYLRHASFKPAWASRSSSQLVSCSAATSTPPITEGYLHQHTLRGKSMEQVLACAGRPVQERQKGQLTLFSYYREAPLLENSMVSSKASLPTVHHGVWTSTALHGNQIDHVHYRFVPSSVEASNDCEEVLTGCSP